MAELAVRSRRSACASSAFAAVLAVLVTGCTAEVNGGQAGAAGTTGSSSGGSSSAGTGNTAGTGASSGAGGSSANGGTGTGTGGGTIDPDAPTPPAPANPGSVTLRRLNRVEYNNTVRDLLGTSLKPADTFQADASGDGYDTVGAALSLSPVAVRDYEDAAYKLVDDLLANSTRLATVVPCDVMAQGETCLRTVLSTFGKRAFRRPVTSEETELLLTPFRTAQTLGGTAPSLALRYTLAAVLVNQHFLFRFEFDADPASTAPRRLDGYELASRLSYALWSTMPDDQLFAAADAGTLNDDAELARQIDRMLADPRAAALSENFAGQWLSFRDPTHEPDVRAFPDYTPALATSMANEAKSFFADFLASQAPVGELLSARFTFVDTALANHYGLPVQAGMGAGQMWRADTTGIPRSGLLTLGAVLTATSMNTRTSPVKRGEFVLKHLLCETVTPPPPDVVGIPDEIDPNQQLTMRQRMEQHRNNEMCIGCHADMDQLGFGLENYDAVGKYRTTDNGLPVDSAGVLPDGSAFTGAVELAALLARDSRFNHCVARNLMTYALGRYLNQPDDAVWVAHIAGKTRDGDGRLGTLVRTLLTSETFRSRQPVVVR